MMNHKNNMLGFVLISLILIFCPGSAQSETTVLKEIQIEQVPTIPKNIKNKVNMRVESVNENDSQKALRIEYNEEETLSILLYEVPLSNIENCVLEYQANIKSENMTNKAYLEMHCVLKGQAFFSRALNQAVSGSTDWRQSSTPFFLKEGEKSTKAILGIRMEAPGIVFIRNLKLIKKEDAFFNAYGTWEWIPGALLGVLGGLYGGFAGWLASRGRARQLINGMGLFMITISVILLITGIILLILGKSWDMWYSFLLPGVLGTIIFPPIIKNITRQYQEAELRRMEALDMMNTSS